MEEVEAQGGHIAMGVRAVVLARCCVSFLAMTGHKLQDSHRTIRTIGVAGGRERQLI